MSPSPLSRHSARELAFQYLFALSGPQSPGTAPSRPSSQEAEAFAAAFQKPFDSFFYNLIDGTISQIEAIDKELAQRSHNWRLERMPKVDLTILRLGAFEILFLKDVPKNVAINEAIELAKTYGTENSAAFINGLLDPLQKKD